MPNYREGSPHLFNRPHCTIRRKRGQEANGVPQVQASRDFLELLPQPQRGTVANVFLNQVRANPHLIAATAVPSARASTVFILVHEALRGRCRRARAGGQYDELAKVGEWLALLDRHPDEALAYAQWCLDYEALPREERERRKRDRGEQYRTAHMDRQAPTDKQVEYLRRMGYDGPIDSKAFASSLIDCYTRGYKVVRRAA